MNSFGRHRGKVRVDDPAPYGGLPCFLGFRRPGQALRAGDDRGEARRQAWILEYAGRPIPTRRRAGEKLRRPLGEGAAQRGETEEWLGQVAAVPQDGGDDPQRFGGRPEIRLAGQGSTDQPMAASRKLWKLS